MRANVRTISGAVLGLLGLTLIVLNWSLLVHRADLHLLFARIEAPIGIVLAIIILSMIGGQFLWLRTRNLLEKRRLRRELEQTSESARHEARSEVDDLQQFVRREIGAVRSQLAKLEEALARPRHDDDRA